MIESAGDSGEHAEVESESQSAIVQRVVVGKIHFYRCNIVSKRVVSCLM